MKYYIVAIQYLGMKADIKPLLLAALTFVFYLWALTHYAISYGIDGPFYDIQVRNVLTTGFPVTNDPPLVYYYMAVFAIVFGTALGIKISMAVIAAATSVVLYYFIYRTVVNRTPQAEFLSMSGAVLVSFNPFALRMVEDFMQNYFGVFFYLIFLLTATSAFAAPSTKRVTIAAVMFLLALGSHLYTAALAVVSLAGLVILHYLAAVAVEHRSIKKEVLISSAIFIGSTAVVVIITAFFPSFGTKYVKIFSFLQDLTTSTYSSLPQFLVFLNIPYILAVVVGFRTILHYLQSDEEAVTKQQYMLLSSLLILALVLFILTLPFIPTKWATRFVLLAFLPLALLIPVGFGEYQVIKVTPQFSMRFSKHTLYAVFGFFMLMSVISSIAFVPTMGPTLTAEQYAELQQINSLSLDRTGVIVHSDSNMYYWAVAIFNMDTVNIQNFSVEDYTGRTVYVIQSIQSVESPFNPQFNVKWFPLAPFGFASTQTQMNEPPQNSVPPTVPQSVNPSAPTNVIPLYNGYYYSFYQLL